MNRIDAIDTTYVFIVPNLAERSVSTIGTVYSFAGCCVVVSRAVAPDKRNATMVFEQYVPNIGVSVCGLVRRRDIRRFKPVKRWKPLVVLDCGFEEVYNLLMLAVLWAIARNIEGGEASSMFAELMTPESRVVLLPCDPVGVHVLEKIVPTERLKESADVRAIVGCHKRAIGKTVGGVWRRYGIILSSQVAVLCVRSITEIWPQTMERPGICG